MNSNQFLGRFLPLEYDSNPMYTDIIPSGSPQNVVLPLSSSQFHTGGVWLLDGNVTILGPVNVYRIEGVTRFSDFQPDVPLFINFGIKSGQLECLFFCPVQVGQKDAHQ